MRDFSNETPVNSSVNWLRLAPAWLSGHLISSVRTVTADSANQTAQTLLAAGMRRVAVPQDAGDRVDFVAKWVQRNQRRVAAGLPISVLVLALSAAEAQAQEELVSLAAQEGVESIVILANGDVQVTYTNGNVVVLAENSVVISATGEVLVTMAVAEGAALSAGVAIAGGMGAVGAAGLGAAGLLASLSEGSADPVTSGSGTGGTTGSGTTGSSTGGGTVTPDSGVGGRVIDGYIAGATVFRDLNNNRILDAGEPNVTSDAAGNFAGLTGTGGVLVSVGGTDISTGKAFTGIMTAPAGATVVTPLTTLVQAMVEQNPTLSVADANLAVVRAFGFLDIRVDAPDGEGSVLAPQNLLTFDPTTNFGGLDVFAAGAKVAAIMLVAAAAAGDTPAEQAAAVRAVALSLADQIAQNPTNPAGGPLTQAAILDALDDALGDDAANEDKTELLAIIINAIEDAEQNDGTFSQVIGAIEDVQTYVQGDLLVNIESGTLPAGLELAGGLANAVSLRPIVSSFPRIFTLSEVVLEEKPLQFNGSGRPGSVVTVTFGGLTSDDIPVNDQGLWRFTLTADDLAKVLEGTPVSTGPFVGEAFVMQAVAKETTGTVTITSPVTTIGIFNVDLTAPDSPEITGQIAGDGIININEANSGVRVQGKVEAGVQQVEYWINDGPRQTTFVMSTNTPTGLERIFEFFLTGSGGAGSLALPTGDAPFTLNIVSIDNGRNRSEVTSIDLDIDRIAPSRPTLDEVNYGSVINAEMAASGVQVSGITHAPFGGQNDPNDTFRLTFDGQTFINAQINGSTYTATLNAGNLPTMDGTYTLRAQRVDTAGNISETTEQITLDRTPPAAPVLNPIFDNAVNATEGLIITGTTELGSSIHVLIAGEFETFGSIEGEEFSIIVTAEDLAMWRLADGPVTVSITAQDGADNYSTAATTTFTYSGPPPEPTAPELYAAALTLDEMIAAVEALIDSDPDTFDHIPDYDYDDLAADLMMQRDGTYSISFTSERISASGSPTALVTNNPTGTPDVSGTFHIPVDLINFANDALANRDDDTGVFEFSVPLQGDQTNTFVGANALDLVANVTNLRMEVLPTTRASLPDDAALRAMLGEDFTDAINKAFTEADGAPINFTYLTIWAPGNSTSDEGQPFTGSDLTLVFSQLGSVGLDAFFTYPEDTISIVTSTQYDDGEPVGEEILATTDVSVSFDPTVVPTMEELGDMLLDAAALRTAVTDVLEAASDGALTVQLLDALVDTAGPAHIEAENALRLLAGEQLQSADVQRLFAFLVQPIADQTAALDAFNDADHPHLTTLTDVLNNPLLLPDSILEGTQVFFDANNPAGLYINGNPVDIAADVRREAELEADTPVEMLGLDLTNPDITWQITPDGNVVVAAFIDGPQAVPQDVILVYAPNGTLKSWVINPENTSESFYVNTTLSDADGVVFSMINTATRQSAGDVAFITYRVPLSEFDSYDGSFTTNVITDDRTPLLYFTVPEGYNGFDFNPTSAIELTDEFELALMLIQFENSEGEGISTWLYTGATPPVVELPVYVDDYSVVLNGPDPLALLLSAYPTVDINDLEDGGVISQESVYYFDLALGEITGVQTMGTNGEQDALFGQGINDIIIPLGVTDSTTEENIYLPVMDANGVQGVETIVVDLNDVFAGNRIAVYGFDLAEDKIAFFGSNLLADPNFSIRPVMVTDADNFNRFEVFIKTSTVILEPQLHFFAVTDESNPDNTILFVTDGTNSGEVAWLNGVETTSAAATNGGLQLSAFPLEELLVPLPT